MIAFAIALKPHFLLPLKCNSHNILNLFLCRGALKYHVKLYSGAIDDLNTAINLDPAHAALAFFNRALCHQATGKPNKVHCTCTCREYRENMHIVKS